MHFASLPDYRADLDPQGPAISDARQSLTNAELLTRVRAASRHLHDLGIGAGDVVAVKLTNRLEFVLLLFASWRVGATVTPVNPSMTDIEVERQLNDSAARLLVVEDGSTTPSTPTLDVETLYTDPADFDPAPVLDLSALSLLVYTSGTTGTPKGVMLDHSNIEAMAEMMGVALALGPTDRSLLILPLFHVNGIIVSILSPLLAGGNAVIVGKFDPKSFFDLVERERPTYFSAVPTIYNMLAALPPEVVPDTSSLRFGACGAAPASDVLLTRFETRYGFPLVEGYGLSEGTCVSTCNPVDGPRRAGSIGLPLVREELRIVDENGTELANGMDGEVIVRGPNIMRGYLGRPEETAKTLIDGWLHTGDMGHIDPDGYVFLVGRSKDMIIRGGENIYPKEIEDVLTTDPSVLEAAVIGVPDEKWGEIVVAYVQPRPGQTIDTATLSERCEQHLSGYKRPTSYFVVDAIPKNAVGKIDKPTIRKAHAAVAANA